MLTSTSMFMLDAIAESRNIQYVPLDKLDAPLVSNPPLAPSCSWPNKLRSIHSYEKVESIKIGMDHLYCPLKSNNPLFNSFCLGRSSKGIILWVFQMTITKEHSGAVSDFAIILTIVQKIKQTLKVSEVGVKFVLVTPFKVDQVVKWNFPEEFKGSSVHIQYLEVSPHL